MWATVLDGLPKTLQALLHNACLLTISLIVAAALTLAVVLPLVWRRRDDP